MLDPSGIELRICRRLQRRAYLSPGPGHTWHIYGYDKLKPYGLAIHCLMAIVEESYGFMFQLVTTIHQI